VVARAAGSAAASRSKKRPRLWRLLGPGLITGAADDDPSGIATYSQAGAQFGFQLAWTLLLTYPLMVVIQGMSARIGCTTGKGIAGNLRVHYPKWVVLSIVGLLFVANTLNIGADLGAMAAAARLLLPAVPGWLCVFVFGIGCTLAQIFCDHSRYIAILKWLTFSLFAYFATLCVVHVRWLELAKGLVWPHFSLNQDFWLMVVAILGTTISPYLFFWQAAQEVEDAKAPPRNRPLCQDPESAPAALARIHLDTAIGMGLSNLVALAIMVTAAATLHESGVHEVGTAADAAKALQPLAGNLAFALFSVGIIGTGLLSIPVLAGSAAYALGEAREWPVGLAQRPEHAKAFYGAIAVATLLGAAANVLNLNPVKALVWAAVLNGLVAVPVMVMLMTMGISRAIMGELRISRFSAVVGWAATGVMAVASMAFIVATVFG
jgi:NRAMP (natural resistance-associated macrophage protein)-like metal ion transporter